MNILGINAFHGDAETYRPFAPSVLEERAAEVFERSESTVLALGNRALSRPV